MKRFLILAGIIAALGLVVFVSKLAGKQSAAITVKTVAVKTGVFQTKLPENGVIQHPRAATVPTLVAGNIEQIYVKAGDNVSAGQLLATIENPSLQSTAQGSQADYTSAQANVETARVNEQNARVTYEGQVQTAKSNLDEAQRVYQADVSLYKSKAIARNQLDADRATLEKMQVAYDQAVRQLRLGAVTGYGENSVQYARAAAEKAAIANSANQQQLAFTRIYAPFSGVVQTVASQPSDPLTPLRAGDAVSAGEGLFTIAEGGTMIVKAQIDEQDVINVHPGQRAIVSGQDFPGRHINGHVETIAPVATKSTDATSTARQVLTTIRLDSSPSYLKDGMTVDVDIVTGDMHNAVLIPSSAIVSEDGKSFVFTVSRGTAHKVKIVTGASNDTQTVVTAGLHAGERILPEKNPSVSDGTRVST